MQVQDIGFNYGGSLTYRKWTLAYNDPDIVALGAVTSGQVKLRVGSGANDSTFIFPAGSKVLGVFVKHSVAFTGTGPLSALTISLGISGGTTTFFTATFDIFQAVAATTVQETAMFKMGQATALTPAVNFVATGGNLNVLTAGSVDVYVLFMDVTTQ